MKNFTTFLFLGFVWGLLAQNKTTYTYAIKGHDTLELDVYTPENIKTGDRLPALLWMHGGGFAAGSRDNKEDAQLCNYAARRGYVGISISYRLLRKGTKEGFGCDCSKENKLEVFKQAANDYLDAAAFIINNAHKLQIDSSQIIAGGSSAGAEGMLNAVFMREHFVEELKRYKDVKFAAMFSCAGAIVNAEYITKENTIPSVLFHGTNDKLVPFSSAPHHYCNSEQPGYLILDGAEVIVKKLKEHGTSFYFNIVKDGGHEISAIPFSDLDPVFEFFNKTINRKKIIQTTVIKTKGE